MHYSVSFQIGTIFTCRFIQQVPLFVANYRNLVQARGVSLRAWLGAIKTGRFPTSHENTQPDAEMLLIILKTITIVALLAAILWFIFEPGFEPAITSIVILAAIVKLYWNDVVREMWSSPGLQYGFHRGDDMKVATAGESQGHITADPNYPGGVYEGANFAGSNLEGFQSKKADYRGANFENANLKGAHFKGSNFENANFKGADLSGVNFKNAILKGAILDDADLSGAFLVKANLLGASINNTKFAGANTKKTIMPRGTPVQTPAETSVKPAPQDESEKT